MSQSSSFSEKIVQDLARAAYNDTSLTSFEIIPTDPSENKNSSPVITAHGTLGIESWVIPHVLPYATRMVLDSSVQRDADKLSPFLTAIVLLNPEMPTAWNRRRDLIVRRKLSCDNEMRLTRMALSRQPKCNEALAHRRWLITRNYVTGEDTHILMGELSLINMIGDRYHSNYHAWTHRQWAMTRLAPVNKRGLPKSSLLSVVSKRTMCYIFSSSFLPFYLDELETNFQFVSTHVSDHSGMHYRQFLVTSIFNIFLTLANSIDAKSNFPVNGDTNKVGLLFYNSVKHEVSEFLKTNIARTTSYVDKLQSNVSLFDILSSLLISELRSNESLSTLYIDHEALWYYRRFLVHMFLECIAESSVDSNNGSLVEFESEMNKVSNSSDNSMFSRILIQGEGKFLDSMSVGNFRTVKNHDQWLKRQRLC